MTSNKPKDLDFLQALDDPPTRAEFIRRVYRSFVIPSTR